MRKYILKYAFVGTSCIGKTTQILEIQKLLSRLNPTMTTEVVPEAARLYFKNHQSDEPFSFESQKNIQQLAISLEENALSKNPQIVLCDRAVIDAIVYLNAVGNYNGAKELTNNVKKWIPSYTYFFLLDPHGIPYKKDAIRRESSETRMSFHHSFVSFFSSHTLPYSLITGPKNKRLEDILTIIYNTSHDSKESPHF